MFYIIIFFTIVIVMILYFRHASVVNQKRRIEKIRQAWGNQKEGPFYFERIAKYADLDEESKFHQLSTQTIEDIDFYGLFSFIDRTTSRIGQQFLFKKLKEPLDKIETLHKLDRDADFFTDNSKLREETQVELQRLNSRDTYYICSLLQGKLLKKPSWYNFLFLSILVVITLIVLSFKYPVFLIFLIIPATVNTFLHYWNMNNTVQFIKSFPQLSLLIKVCDTISKTDIHFRNKLVEKSLSALKPFQWKMRLLRLSNDGSIKDDLNQMTSYFTELVKGFFLIEVFTLFHLTKQLETKKEFVLTLFNYIGEIDSAISVASLRAGTLKTCRPDFIQTNRAFSVKNVFHPLIEDCVKNDLTLHGKSVLITGSNMSGKTTFLRTLIINSILAQTIYTCFADEFKTSILKQFSSIRIDDNLFEGKSYYFEEVRVMASLIKEVESGYQNLFILDEVFKGTNTIERIASAKAILSYLNRNNNIAIVSTHDIELSDMLKNEYDLYHFTETIEKDQLHFDHKIKAGPLTTRNAIKILEIANYPIDIIKEAKELSLTLTSKT